MAISPRSSPDPSADPMQISFMYVIAHPWNRLRHELHAAESRLVFDFGQHGQQRAVTPHAARVQARADVNRRACASAGSSFPQLSGRQYRAVTRLSSEMLYSYDIFDRPFPNLPPSRGAPKPTEQQRKHRTERRGPAYGPQRPFTSPVAADDTSRLPEVRHTGPWSRKPAFSSSSYSSSMGRMAAARSASGTRAAHCLRALELR